MTMVSHKEWPVVQGLGKRHIVIDTVKESGKAVYLEVTVRSLGCWEMIFTLGSDGPGAQPCRLPGRNKAVAERFRERRKTSGVETGDKNPDPFYCQGGHGLQGKGEAVGYSFDVSVYVTVLQEDFRKTSVVLQAVIQF